MNRDKLILEYIFSHYDNLVNDLNDEILSDERKQRLCCFSLFQIGENVNHLSLEIKNTLNKNDLNGIVDVRNFIGHGYDTQLRMSEINKILEEDLPNLINQLKQIYKLIKDFE